MHTHLISWNHKFPKLFPQPLPRKQRQPRLAVSAAMRKLSTNSRETKENNEIVLNKCIKYNEARKRFN